MDYEGDFYDYHQDESDTAEAWEENQVFLDHEGQEEEEEEEDSFAHRRNSGYCAKCWNGVCQYDDDGNFVGDGGPKLPLDKSS